MKVGSSQHPTELRPFGLRFYRAATSLASPAAGALLRRRERRGKEHSARLPERQGVASVRRPNGRLVWVHAASVGEALSALPLIKGIQDAYSSANILMTTGTLTSAELIAQRAPDLLHQFVPIDTPGAVQRFLEHWRPDLALWVESELWPNLVIEAARRDVPSALVNARLSEKSAKGWRRAPNSIRALLNAFDLCLAQNEVLRDRLTALGADPQRTIATGDLKAARAAEPINEAELHALRSDLAGRVVWLAASTHAGDENAVLAAHETLQQRYDGLATIIVPRHPERGEALQRASGGALRSKGAKPDQGVYIADTLGELGLWYALAPLSFIGGSWHGEGGHNPMEAAQRGTAILSGASVVNFEMAYARLIEGGAADFVEPQALASKIAALLGPDGQGTPELYNMQAASKAHGEPDPRPLETAMSALEPLLAKALG